MTRLASLQLTELPSPAVVGMKTSSNEAYEMVKQGGELDDGYELMVSPPRGPPEATQEGIYEIPSPPQEPLPAIPPPVAGAGEEAVYEPIPD